MPSSCNIADENIHLYNIRRPVVNPLDKDNKKKDVFWVYKCYNILLIPQSEKNIFLYLYKQ